MNQPGGCPKLPTTGQISVECRTRQSSKCSEVLIFVSCLASGCHGECRGRKPSLKSSFTSVFQDRSGSYGGSVDKLFSDPARTFRTGLTACYPGNPPIAKGSPPDFILDGQTPFAAFTGFGVVNSLPRSIFKFPSRSTIRSGQFWQ